MNLEIAEKEYLQKEQELKNFLTFEGLKLVTKKDIDYGIQLLADTIDAEILYELFKMRGGNG